MCLLYHKGKEKGGRKQDDKFFFFFFIIEFCTQRNAVNVISFIYHSLEFDPVRPEKFQFMEKWQNRNFGYEIVISVKN